MNKANLSVQLALVAFRIWADLAEQIPKRISFKMPINFSSVCLLMVVSSMVVSIDLSSQQRLIKVTKQTVVLPLPSLCLETKSPLVLALGDRRQLEEVSGQDQLDTSKGLVGTPDLASHLLQLGEKDAIDHGYLINDQVATLLPTIKDRLK